MENELSQLSVGDLASWSPFLQRMLGSSCGERCGGLDVKSLSAVNSPLSSGKPFQGSRFRKTLLPSWIFVFDSWISFAVNSLPDSIISNICEFMRSTAVLRRLLPDYPDLVLDNLRYIRVLLNGGSIPHPRVWPLDLLTISSCTAPSTSDSVQHQFRGAGASSLSIPDTTLEEKM